MRKLMWVAISTIIILLASSLLVSAETNLNITLSNSTRETDLVPVTKWAGPGRPTFFNETKISTAPFSIRQVYPAITPPSDTTLVQVDSKDLKQYPKPADHKLSPPLISGKVYVLVNSTIYVGIETALAQYEYDVEKSGLSVVIYSGTWGTPEDIRSFLQGALPNGLVGALLVGDIPVAWYEIYNDFGTDGYTDFPIDLFYMDLNGTWSDSNNNRIYDNHTGHVAPEIWVGRLYASSLSGNEITLLQNYFDKNHKYRTGFLSSLDRALAYIDDDWVPWADSWSDAVGLVYNNRTLVKDKSTTIATDYKNRLTQNYEHILLAAHSSPILHQFNNNDSTYSYVYYSDIQSINPHALFYNLFACSNARYIENDYMAGWYIFANTYGLAAVGSTKTGSMLGFQYFYDPLSQNKNLGEAFKEWFIIQGITHQSWHYGMVLLGDPTLTPKIKDVSISSSDITYHPFTSKLITINAMVHNTGDTQLNNIIVQFYNGNPALGGSQIGSDKIIDLINASENKTISMIWNTSVGSYDIYVVVDPYNSIIEIDETNNKAYQTITVQEPTNTILLVDDDYFYRSYSYEAYYKNALDAGNYSYNIWHVSALGSSPNATILSSYQVVIWFTGDDWSTTLTATDQTNLQSYLDSGGNLFISGQDIGWDLTNNGTVANTFYSNYLHARYVRDDTNIYDLHGITGDLIGGGLIINTTGGDGASNQGYPSEIAPNDTYTSTIFNYTGNGCGAIKANANTYKVVYFAFGFEAINNATDRNTVMSRVVIWLDTIAPVVIANPTGYPSGYTAAKNGTTITLNASISDVLTGVKNATVNVSQINSSLEEVVLSYSNGFWTNSSVIVSASDRTYYLNITAYDNASNLNNTAQVIVIVDNTPPLVYINQTSYQRGNAANNGSIIGFNVSASDNLAGLKNASVNASLINNTGSIELINQSGFWKGNATFDKFKPDGFYLLNVTFFDNAGNLNDSAQINVSIDNTPPSVTDVSLSSQFINVSGSTNITANITDTVSQVNPDEVFSRVTYPNGTSIDYTMSSNSLFYLNFTDTAQYGRFNVTILANDTTGNTNSTQKTRFVTTLMTNTSVETNASNETIIFAPFSNTTLRLFTNNTSIGAINIAQSRVNITSRAMTITNPGIYVLVNASESIKNNLSYAVISVNYTDAEVSSYVESSLRLYRWNTTSMDWDKLSGPGSYSYENDAGVDTVNNFVWANLTALSEFAVAGDMYVAPPPPSAGGGGGGGGGGGTSGEDYANIEVKEKYDLHIFKDRVTSYAFTNGSNPVLFVNITGNVSAGEITTSVEVLRNTSSLVKNPAPGMVYKNINIWVGTSGFPVPRNIKEAVIRFRVENSWLASNGFAPSDVSLLQCSEDQWNRLETGTAGKDDRYTFFEATTDHFSPFTISASRGVAPLVKPLAGETPVLTVAATPTAKAIQPPTPGIPAWAYGIIIVLAALGIAAYYLLVLRKKPGRG